MASLTLTWTAASPAPANGYRIKYWPTDSPTTISIVSPNPIASPYTINGLAEITPYSGTIEASCEGSAFSTAVSWNTPNIIIVYFYFATKFSCANCTQVATNVFVWSATQLTIGRFYKLDQFVYRIDTAEPDDNNFIDISGYTASAATCAELCPSNITIDISLDLAGGARAQATGQAVLYTSSDGTNYTVASTVLNTQGASQSITPIPGNYYYLRVTKTAGCVGESCGAVRPQVDWNIDGISYGLNVGGVPNGSFINSDPIQIATSGTHTYNFYGYVDFVI
jgi:hypothetical protein